MFSIRTEQQHELLFWTQHSFGLSGWCTGRVEKINVIPLIILNTIWNGYGRKQINTRNVDIPLEENNWCQCFTYSLIQGWCVLKPCEFKFISEITTTWIATYLSFQNLEKRKIKVLLHISIIIIIKTEI